MEISIDIPDWPVYEGRTLHILAGIEEVAYKRFGESWKVKAIRCDMCGKCCMNVPENWPHGEKENNCKHLIYVANEYRCGLLGNRPYKCCISDDAEEDYCRITWETQ